MSYTISLFEDGKYVGEIHHATENLYNAVKRLIDNAGEATIDPNPEDDSLPPIGTLYMAKAGLNIREKPYTGNPKRFGKWLDRFDEGEQFYVVEWLIDGDTGETWGRHTRGWSALFYAGKPTATPVNPKII